MNIQEFFILWLNKFNNFDGAYGPQCVDIIKQYFKDMLGINPITGNAIDYFKEIPGFTKIAKTVDNHPLPGDIVIWDRTVSPSGHIGICNWTTLAGQFNCFEQNWPLNSPCHFQTHTSYKGVVGWLRPDHVNTGNATRPGQPTHPTDQKAVMNYTCFNSDQAIMEQARQLVFKYSGGLIDVVFQYQTIPEVSVSGLLTSENQLSFLKDHPIQTKFAFLRYTSTNTPNYDFMSTNELPLPTTPILTISEGAPTPFGICYEMTHAIQMRCRQLGLSVSIDDVFTPSEDFLIAKVNTVLPFIKQNGGVI